MSFVNVAFGSKARVIADVIAISSVGKRPLLPINRNYLLLKTCRLCDCIAKQSLKLGFIDGSECFIDAVAEQPQGVTVEF